MTIIVFDKKSGLAYADSRVSIINSFGNAIKYNKMLKLKLINKRYVIGGAGNVSAINEFSTYLKRHHKTPKKLYSGECSILSFDTHTGSTHINQYIKKKSHYGKLLFIIGALLLLQIFINTPTTLIVLFIFLFYTVFFLDIINTKSSENNYLFVPNYWKTISTGSGMDVFENRNIVYDDIMQSLHDVNLLMSCCDDDIKTMDISGKYFNEDTH